MPTYLVPAAMFAWLFSRKKPPANTAGTHRWSKRTSERLGNPPGIYELFDNGEYLLTYGLRTMRVIEFASWATNEQFDAAVRDIGVHFGDP